MWSFLVVLAPVFTGHSDNMLVCFSFAPMLTRASRRGFTLSVLTLLAGFTYHNPPCLFLLRLLLV